MDRAGERLKRIRERLGLTYRDVEEASQRIADRLGNPEFAIALSRLADIENKGSSPSIYRLYSLCAVYRLDVAEVLCWYGAPVDQMPREALRIELERTHPVGFRPEGMAPWPIVADGEIDSRVTTFLSRLVLGWGAAPLRFLDAHDVSRKRYGLIGLEDWSMYPVLHPGSLVVVEERSRIASGGWTNEYDRPIYFLETRERYLCGWCDLEGDRLIVQPHPGSPVKASAYRFPGEIDLIGEVTGVAMLLGSAKRRHARTAATPAASPGR